MSQPTIKDVLTEEGFQKFIEKGIGEKLSGVQYREDDPANALFWAMFRRAEEQRREADEQEEQIEGYQKELELSNAQLSAHEHTLERYQDMHKTTQHKMELLKETVVKLSVERMLADARMEAMTDGF